MHGADQVVGAFLDRGCQFAALENQGLCARLDHQTALERAAQIRGFDAAGEILDGAFPTIQ